MALYGVIGRKVKVKLELRDEFKAPRLLLILVQSGPTPIHSNAHTLTVTYCMQFTVRYS